MASKVSVPEWRLEAIFSPVEIFSCYHPNAYVRHFYLTDCYEIKTFYLAWKSLKQEGKLLKLTCGSSRNQPESLTPLSQSKQAKLPRANQVSKNCADMRFSHALTCIISVAVITTHLLSSKPIKPRAHEAELWWFLSVL